MPNGEQPLVSPPELPSRFSKRDVAITVAAAGLIIIIVVLLIRALAGLTVPSRPEVGENQPSRTAAVNSRPIPVTPNLKAWRGVLTLTPSDASLASAGQTYLLFIKAPGASSKILTGQGYKNGDQVSVIGKISGKYLEVSGMSK